MNHSVFRNKTLTSWFDFRLSVVVISLCIIGLILNITLCVTIFTKKNLQQPINRLIANLAISDMIHCILLSFKFTYPAVVASNPQFYSNLSFSTITLVCNTLAFTGILGVSSSMITLAVIGIERYRAIIYPLKSPLSKQHIKFFFPVIWTISVTTALILVVGRDYTTYEVLDCTGAFSSRGTVRNAALTTIFATISIFIPIVIIICCYVTIAIKLCRKTIPMDESDYKIHMARIEHKKNACVVTLLVMTILSALSFCPFSTLFLWITYSKLLNPQLHKTLPYQFWSLFQSFIILLILPCILNPILYNIASNSYRKEMKNLLKSIGLPIFRRKIWPESKKTDSTSRK
ncbi:Neuropeptide FF receptor 1 [Trichoplax sp. H2]|nr:Neuropeptide FF receptor 1 [Trichoplax sp. H2]|eukprot:RDD38201.1 Neuropeptide FF receptor 1 [Trichoplax sp. H2]